jgi:hypothetical protein
MSEQGFDSDPAMWRRIVEGHIAFSAALQAFFATGVNRVALMRQALSNPRDAGTAIYVAQFMDAAELLEIFDEWVGWAACSHGYAQAVREIILALPRDWVLAHIETVAEPLLQQGTYDEYRRLLELYIQLGYNLTHRLATRAAKDPDPDIREAGEEFLEALSAHKER